MIVVVVNVTLAVVILRVNYSNRFLAHEPLQPINADTLGVCVCLYVWGTPQVLPQMQLRQKLRWNVGKPLWMSVVCCTQLTCLLACDFSFPTMVSQQGNSA